MRRRKPVPALPQIYLETVDTWNFSGLIGSNSSPALREWGEEGSVADSLSSPRERQG